MDIEVQQIQRRAVELRGEFVAGLLRSGFAFLGRWSARVGKAIYGEVRDWRDRENTKAELMILDNRILRDIGINRSDIPRVVANTVAQHPEQVPYNRAA